MNCCVVPAEIEGFAGVTAIDTKVGAAAKNVMVAEPNIEPELAVMVELPGPAPDAWPLLVTLATAAFDEVHVAEPVRSCVLPSLKVPVAANCCVVPNASEGFAGVTTIDCSTAAVIVSGAEPLMLFSVAVTCTTP